MDYALSPRGIAICILKTRLESHGSWNLMARGSTRQLQVSCSKKAHRVAWPAQSQGLWNRKGRGVAGLVSRKVRGITKFIELQGSWSSKASGVTRHA